MRVGLIAYLLHGGASYRAAGVSVYAQELLTNLPIAAPSHLYLAFEGHDAPSIPEIRPVFAPIPSERPPFRILWEQAGLPLQCLAARVDILHGLVNVVPWLTPIPRVVTVHDLSFLRHPERFHRSKVLYLRTAVQVSARASRHIIAVSDNTRHDLIELLGIPADRVSVIHPGVHPRFRPLPGPEMEQFRAAEGIVRPYILHVGTLEPRKNIDILIRAYAHLRRAPGIPHRLVLVGARGWMYEPLFALVRELGLENDVRFIDYVAPDDLPLWYNGADLFAYPSAYEGFGFPLVEAMACGVPAVTSSSSSLAEVSAGATLTVEPGSVETLQMAIARVLQDPDVAADLRSRGLARAQDFSWRRTAEQTVRVYEAVLAS